jgi:hypothetical protein
LLKRSNNSNSQNYEKSKCERVDKTLETRTALGIASGVTKKQTNNNNNKTTLEPVLNEE